MTYNDKHFYCIPGQENQSSRLTRSLHALQSQLCPAGSSSERCFYSQLSMFIRMHDSIMDPVALRNIGKRNVPTRNFGQLQNNKNTDFSLNVLPVSELQTRLEEIRNIAGMINILKDLLDERKANEASEEPENSFIQPVLFHPEEVSDRQNNELRNMMLPVENFSGDYSLETANVKDSMDNAIADILGLKGNEETDNNDGIVESKVKKDISRNVPLEKRQLICPPDSTERECFDNAFSYYVRLLKSLKSH